MKSLKSMTIAGTAEKPLVVNGSEQDKARNRRVELVMLK